MLQLIVVFYGPYYVFGLKLSTAWRLYATLIGFSINYAAYFAEIFRAGIQSIPVGQTEAATVLGYTKTQTFLKIIFPQMVKRTIPPVTNEVITCQAGIRGYVQPYASLCGGRILLRLQLSSHAHHEQH